MIRDVNGCSKGYYFVDFRSEVEAKRLLEEKETINNKEGRKLLVRPAIRVNKKEVLFVKRRPTANSAANSATLDSASSDSDILPSHWTEAADIPRTQHMGISKRRGVGQLSLNVDPVTEHENSQQIQSPNLPI